MNKRTQDEVNRQIEGINKMKEWLPEYSNFGNNNWGKIDAQLDILEGSKSLSDFEDDEIVDEESDEIEDNEILQAAREADDWLNGYVSDDLFEER